MKTILSAVQTWTKGKIKDSTADWNQNDETKPDYVKNRTHWEEIAETVLVSEQTIEGFALMQEPLYAVQNPFSIQLQPNQTYTVTWDGASYDLRYNEVEDGFGFIGNENYFNMQSGGDIPFVIVINYFDGLIIIATESAAESHTISISTLETITHKLDSKYLDLPTNLATTDDVQEALAVEITALEEADATKMDKTNPVGTGSFSMNRRAGTAVGNYSHAEGSSTTASGRCSHAEGSSTTASGDCSHAEGQVSIASGPCSHAECDTTTAKGFGSHAEGGYTIASGDYSHVQGKFNVENTNSKYAHIVGNGTSSARSNAHTLDWHGNAWYAGDVYIGSTSGINRDEGSKKLATEEYVDNSIAEAGFISTPITATVGQTIIVKSIDENGVPTEWEAVDSWIIQSSTEGSAKKFKIAVDDSGVLSAVEVVEETTTTTE